MARPWKHPKTGVYHLRRRVPADLVKLVGREIEKRSLGTKDPSEAKALHFAATIEVEERWANLRKGNQPLSNRQVQALAGGIYSRKVAEHADEPGAPEEWRRRTLADRSLQGLWKLGAGKPSALRLATGWSEAEAVVRSRHGGDVDRFIASKGLIVTEADRRRIVLAAADANDLANESLLRNAEGDYTPDRKAERFPEPFAAAGPLKLDVLWAEYRRSLQPSEATVKRWHPILQKFTAFVGTEDIRRVTTADVIRWRDRMLDEAMDLSPLTVRDVYLAAPKALFGFAVSQSRIGSNPAAGVVVRVKKRKKLRKSGFSAEEADLILSASLAPQNGLASRELKDARRWVPWLCAYSGALVNEITQLRAQDVRRSEGVWVMGITPEAGNTKTGPREVPLHDHLVEQGFLDFVRSKKAGPLFYSVERQRGASAGNPTYVKVGGKLAEWVRAVGVDDENVQPNHGWRHRFKTIGRAVGIDSAKLDAIQGHAPATEGDKYGEFLPDALKREIDKIPRYEVVAGAAVDRRKTKRIGKPSASPGEPFSEWMSAMASVPVDLGAWPLLQSEFRLGGLTDFSTSFAVAFLCSFAIFEEERDLGSTIQGSAEQSRGRREIMAPVPKLKDKHIAVIGCGPKAVAIATKAYCLRSHGVPIAVTIFERHGIGAAWDGRHGYTDGEQRLCTPAERDLGFPYSGALVDDKVGPSIDLMMQAEFSWASFLVANPPDPLTYSDWVGRGRKPPPHKVFVDYLRYAMNKVGVPPIICEVASLDVVGDKWEVRYKPQSARLERVLSGFDGVVVTGPGPAGNRLPKVTDGRVMTGQDFWSKLPSVKRMLKGSGKSVVIVGGGGTAAAIAAWLVRNTPECAVHLLNNTAALFTRTANFFENRMFDEHGPWFDMSPADRRDFATRLNRGVVWEAVTDVLADAPKLRLHAGVASSIVHGTSLVPGQVPPIIVKYKRIGVEKEMGGDLIIDTTGFDAWWFRKLLPPRLVHRLAPSDKRRVKALEEGMRPDLSFSVRGLPRFHAPMHSQIRGPGYASLMALGGMADQILVPFTT